MAVPILKGAFSKLKRRKRTAESHEWWEHLNYAQKFSVSSLYKFGYELCFIRTEGADSKVVLSLDDKFATVDKEGLIDTNPDVKFRRN